MNISSPHVSQYTQDAIRSGNELLASHMMLSKYPREFFQLLLEDSHLFSEFLDGVHVALDQGCIDSSLVGAVFGHARVERELHEASAAARASSVLLETVGGQEELMRRVASFLPKLEAIRLQKVNRDLYAIRLALAQGMHADADSTMGAPPPAAHAADSSIPGPGEVGAPGETAMLFPSSNFEGRVWSPRELRDEEHGMPIADLVDLWQSIESNPLAARRGAVVLSAVQQLQVNVDASSVRVFETAAVSEVLGHCQSLTRLQFQSDKMVLQSGLDRSSSIICGGLITASLHSLVHLKVGGLLYFPLANVALPQLVTADFFGCGRLRLANVQWSRLRELAIGSLDLEHSLDTESHGGVEAPLWGRDHDSYPSAALACTGIRQPESALTASPSPSASASGLAPSLASCFSGLTQLSRLSVGKPQQLLTVLQALPQETAGRLETVGVVVLEEDFDDNDEGVDRWTNEARQALRTALNIAAPKCVQVAFFNGVFASEELVEHVLEQICAAQSPPSRFSSRLERLVFQAASEVDPLTEALQELQERGVRFPWEGVPRVSVQDGSQVVVEPAGDAHV